MDFNDFVTALMLPHFLVQYDYVEAAQPGRNLCRLCYNQVLYLSISTSQT